MIPYLQAPTLLIFTEATQVLLQSSQALLKAGILEADLPEQVGRAYQQAQHKLQTLYGDLDSALCQRVQVLLQLTPPERVMALVQDLSDRGTGPDWEAFLDQVGQEESTLRFPKILVYPEALRQLSQHLPIADQNALQPSIDQLQAQLIEHSQQLDLDSLIQDTHTWLSEQPLPVLEQLIQHYLDEDDLTESGPPQDITVAGPVLFMELVDYLLSQTELELTPDQRLDLQTNRMKAEARYQAMDKLGRIDQVEQQKQLIQTWMAQQTPQAILAQLDTLFSVIDSE